MSDEKEIERKVAIDDEVIRMLRMRTSCAIRLQA